ncbi:MAG TPA: PAS domain S-box protein [Candidatus Acidoferrum sp.]|nr:PAS domain S-box protein [Candidatus Acidoferrum sp.]
MPIRGTKAGRMHRVALGKAQTVVARPNSEQAEDLMDLAVDAARSRHLPDFLKRFSERAAAMADAVWGGVIVFEGAGAELYCGKNLESVRNAPKREWVLSKAREISRDAQVCILPQEKSSTGVFVPILSSSNERLGAVCLLRPPRALQAHERRLLEALASHAALALENFRRFSQLERSKRNWVQDIDAITDYMVVHDKQWRILRTNRSLATHLGVPPVALVGENVGTLRQLAETEGTLPCPFCIDTQQSREEHIVTARDRVFLVSTSRTTGVPDDDARTIHVLKDITDRREAERRYRELFDSIQEGLFFATPDGRFLDVNDAMVRMLGYESRDELMRNDVGAYLYPDPAARERILKELNAKGVLRNYEETLRRKDGRLLYTLQNITGVRDASGRIAQMRGLMLDVTEQKMFQAQLQRERDFNQKILNTTQSMILVLDTAGLISYANRRCYEVGYKEEEMIGRHLVDLVDAAQREEFVAALETTAHGHQVENLEARAKRGDGTLGYFSISLSPMRDEQNAVNSVVVVMTDITDAALLQAKLAHAERMATIGRLVSGVAHEVNNPLAAILGFTDLLIENPEIPASAHEPLNIILQETQRTKNIVQDLLSFARQRPVQREPVKLGAILRQTIKLRSYDFSSHGVEVVEEFAEDLPATIGDSQQLQQVFLNIVNNAYDAIQEAGRRGKITIKARKAGESVEVTLTDNGIGISDPAKIFDPFFTTKPTGKGTGLGLSICYGIVRAHGGEIQAWNNESGQGSTFLVRLPAATEAAMEAAG